MSREINYDCGKIAVGDKGQRYEVRALDENDKEFVLGWTDKADGGAHAECIKRHPVWHSPKIIDRKKPKPD